MTITGRLGDRIIRSGENISAAEVEQHLEAHPAVRQAVAVAEPDDLLGERGRRIRRRSRGLRPRCLPGLVRAAGRRPLHDTREDPSGGGASRTGIWQSRPHEACRQLEGAARQLKTARRQLERAFPQPRRRRPVTPPATMAAAVYRRPGELDVADVPVPAVGPSDALVEVAYCGVCGTDLHMVLDGWGTPGHRLRPRVVGPGDRRRRRGPHRHGHCGGGTGLDRVRPLPALPGGTARTVRSAPPRRNRRRPLGRFCPLSGRRSPQPNPRPRRGQPAGGGLRGAAGGGHPRRHSRLVPAGRTRDGVRLRPDRRRGGGRADRPGRGRDRGRALGAAPGSGPPAGCRGPLDRRSRGARPSRPGSRRRGSAGCSRPPGPAKPPSPG